MSDEVNTTDNSAKSERLFGIALCYICTIVLIVIGEGVSTTGLSGPGAGILLLFVALPTSLVFIIIYAYKSIKFGVRHKRLLVVHILGLISLILIPTLIFSFSSH
jgi:hypothetical protein